MAKDNTGGGSGGESGSGRGDREKAKTAWGKLIEAAVAPIKGLLPENYANEIISFFDPELIDTTAKSIVERVGGFLQKFPFLKSRLGSRFFSVLSGNIGKEIRKDYDGFTAAVIEKSGDLVKAIAAELKKYENDDVSPDAVKHLDPKTREKLAELDAQFLTKYDEVVVPASVGELPDAHAHFMNIAKGRKEVQELTVHVQKKKPEPKEPGVPLREHFANIVRAVNASTNRFCTELASQVQKWQAGTEQMKREQAAKKNPARNKMAKRFSRLLLGFPK